MCRGMHWFRNGNSLDRMNNKSADEWVVLTIGMLNAWCNARLSTIVLSSACLVLNSLGICHGVDLRKTSANPKATRHKTSEFEQTTERTQRSLNSVVIIVNKSLSKWWLMSLWDWPKWEVVADGADHSFEICEYPPTNGNNNFGFFFIQMLKVLYLFTF